MLALTIAPSRLFLRHKAPPDRRNNRKKGERGEWARSSMFEEHEGGGT